MDVRITYGIDLDKVPEKIGDLIREVNIDELCQMIDLVCQLLDLSNAEMAENLVEQVRLKLASVDRILNDSQMILGGFIKAKNQTDVPVEEAPPKEVVDVD